MADVEFPVKHLIRLLECAQSRIFDADHFDGTVPDGLREAVDEAKKALTPYAVMSKDTVFQDPDDA